MKNLTISVPNDLYLFCEKTFGVTLPDTEIEPDNLRSFNALEQWIDRARRD